MSNPVISQSRMIPRRSNRNNKQPDILRYGMEPRSWRDLYHLLLTISWPGFLGLASLLYIGVNTLFALLYLLGGDCIGSASPGSFAEAFFFSVQTLGTIGYGVMHPVTLYANCVVTVEVLFGLLGVAMVTGLMFAKFSRPTARVLFSEVAVIAPQEGIPTLMFRAANQRLNQIIEAQVRVALVRDEMTKEGQYMRRIYELPLTRSQSAVFSLTWSIMHPITETSPLFGATPESLEKQAVEIIVSLTGIDETVSQTIHARHSFIASEILWNQRFHDIIFVSPEGQRGVDYRNFHKVEPF